MNEWHSVNVLVMVKVMMIRPISIIITVIIIIFIIIISIIIICDFQFCLVCMTLVSDCKLKVFTCKNLNFFDIECLNG